LEKCIWSLREERSIWFGRWMQRSTRAAHKSVTLARGYCSLKLAVKVGRFVYGVFWFVCIGASKGNRPVGGTSTTSYCSFGVPLDRNPPTAHLSTGPFGHISALYAFSHQGQISGFFQPSIFLIQNQLFGPLHRFSLLFFLNISVAAISFGPLKAYFVCNYF